MKVFIQYDGVNESIINVTEKSKQDIRYHFNPSALNSVNDIKALGCALITAVDSLGDSREASVAKTQIETAIMWAVKAATR